jgi:hypothetical protein
MDDLRTSCRVSRNVTVRQQIGLEETIIKETEQNSSHGTAMFKERQKEYFPK